MKNRGLSRGIAAVCLSISMIGILAALYFEICTAYKEDDFSYVEYPDGVIITGLAEGVPAEFVLKMVIPQTINGIPVTIIGSDSFSGMIDDRSCSQLQTVVIPEGVTQIESYAFWGCEHLSKVEIPETVTQIGGKAFSYTTWLEDSTQEFVIVGDQVLIDYNGTDCNFTVPESVKHVNLAGDEFIESIVLPDGIEEIQTEAFFFCENLKKIVIPESVKEIGAGAFWGCESLTDIGIPEGIGRIEAYTFFECKSLKTIIIPSSVTDICSSAFGGCTSLEEITIPQGTQVETDAFEAFTVIK